MHERESQADGFDSCCRSPVFWKRSQLSVLALVFLCVGASSVLRFESLGGDLLWHDEVYTRMVASGYQAADWQRELYENQIFYPHDAARFQHRPAASTQPTQTPWTILHTLSIDEPQHPPLYYLLAHVWLSLFGENLSALRALSATLSLLAFPALYWLSRELFHSRRVALGSLALWSASPFFFLYAREAREYALWSVLLLLSCASLLRALRLQRNGLHTSKDRFRGWAIYALTTTLALYTSFNMAGVYILQLAFALVCIHRSLHPGANASVQGSRTRLTLSGLSLVSPAIAFAPWVWRLLTHFGAFEASMAWSSAITIPRATLLAQSGINLSRALFDFWPDPTSAASWFAVGATGILLAMAAGWTLRHCGRRESFFVLALLLVPLGLLLVPDLLFGGIRSLSTRYLTPSLIAVELLFAFALLSRGPRSRVRFGLALLVLALGFGSIVTDHKRDVTWNKGLSRALPPIAQAIHAQHEPQQSLLIASREQHHPGNIFALCHLLDDHVALEFALDPSRCALPPDRRHVFLYSPTIAFRQELEQRTGRHAHRLVNDLFAQLWILQP